MDIRFARRVQQAIGEVDALLVMVAALSESLTKAEERIKALEQQQEQKRGPGRPPKNDR